MSPKTKTLSTESEYSMTYPVRYSMAAVGPRTTKSPIPKRMARLTQTLVQARASRLETTCASR